MSPHVDKGPRRVRKSRRCHFQCAAPYFITQWMPSAQLGFIHEDHLRELLTTMGDRFTDEEVDELFREAPIDKKGNFNYAEFTRILKHGAKDKDDE